MANLARVRVQWSGTAVVGPGVSTFYFDEGASGFTDDLADLFTVFGSYVPTGVAWSCDSSGDLIDVATGEITGTWTDPSGFVLTAGGSGTFAQGVGARIVWPTNGIRNGRRVKGSTFVCPLGTGVFDASGDLSTAIQTALYGAAAALVSARGTTMKIYSRPLPGNPGAASTVVAAQVPSAVSWLRTRRT